MESKTTMLDKTEKDEALRLLARMQNTESASDSGKTSFLEDDVQAILADNGIYPDNIIGIGGFDTEGGTWQLGTHTNDPEIASQIEAYQEKQVDLIKDDGAEQKDWQRYWNDAYSAELERRKETYSAEEARYMLAQELYFLNADGELKSEPVLGHFRYNPHSIEPELNLNALGYDRYPPDIQVELGNRDKVIGNWVTLSEETMVRSNAFYDYTQNDKGYDTWEEYRDAHGLKQQEEITIELAQEVDTNDKPRETPAVDQDIQILITK